MNDNANLAWRKSSFSVDGNCVEVAVIEYKVEIRDSTDLTGPLLSFGYAAWISFLEGVRGGRRGRPVGPPD